MNNILQLKRFKSQIFYVMMLAGRFSPLDEFKIRSGMFGQQRKYRSCEEANKYRNLLGATNQQINTQFNAHTKRYPCKLFCYGAQFRMVSLFCPN